MLDFVVFDDVGFREYVSWFSDPELRNRVATPTDDWLHYVRNTPGVYAWLVIEGTSPMGFVQLDVAHDRTGDFAVVVKPAVRGQGVCKRILKMLLVRHEVKRLDVVRGQVKQDNVASQHCLQSVGFMQERTEPDLDGFLTFVRLSTTANEQILDRS